MSGYVTYESLATEAIRVYGADPARVQRAVELLQRQAVHLARYDRSGLPVVPSLEIFAVAGSQGWYTVSHGECTCKDHQLGHVCKHRLAAWMYREVEIRNQAAVKTSVQHMQSVERMK